VTSYGVCPGFDQDRVNSHRTPGRGTAGWWGLTPPGQTEPGIPYHVTLGSGRRGEARPELTHGSGARGAGPVRESGSVLRSVLSCFLLICIVVAVPSVCCSVKLPLSRPTSFCLCFLSILLRTAAGGGAAAWRFLLPAAAETKTVSMLTN